MLGYESYVLLNGTIIPAISADTSEDRTRIDSSGVYGGGIEINTPLSSPHFYDWPAITGNVTFEASKETLNVVKNMIFHRNTPFGIKIITRIAGEQEVKKAWWNSISIQASEDSIVNITISFVGIERNSFAVGTFNGYWENVEGLYGSFCFNPIPFWKTKINGMENVRGWTFTLTQDVTRFLGCMNFSGNVPKNPYILGIGVLACDMKIQKSDMTNPGSQYLNRPEQGHLLVLIRLLDLSDYNYPI